MASSGYIDSGTPGTQYGIHGAIWRVYWSAEPTDEAGVTKVKWDAYTTGRSSSPTRAYARLNLYVYNHAGGTIVEGSGALLGSYSSGDYNTVDYTHVWRMGGSFNVKHSTDGSGGFSMLLDANIAGHDTDGSGVGVLDANVPYYYVYIDNECGFAKAIPYIHNGTEWKVATAYIDTGTEWKVCS
jgi:hypothetical protein